MTDVTFVDNLTLIEASWLNDVNTTVNTTVPGLAASKADLAGSSTQAFAASDLTVGDQGTEGSGINIGGVVYQSSFKVSDIDGTHFAQTILHRHSTVLEPVIVGARSNSNTSGHTAVTNDQGLLTMFAAGVAGTNYKLFGSQTLGVDATGTISDTSAPGKWSLSLTPNGSVIPTIRMTITNSGKTTITSTESLVIPKGTTAQRDATPTVGGIRFNESLNQYEAYTSVGWGSLGGGTSGGGTDEAFYQNDSVVTTAYNIGQDAQMSGATFTNGIATIGMTAHGYVAGSQVCFTTTGSLPTNFAIGTKYHVIATGLTADQLQVSATYGGSAIVAGSAGSGTHSMGKVKNAQMTGPITFLAAVGSTGGRLVVI